MNIEQINSRIEKATAAFDAGFTSKAGKKQASDQLNRAFESVRGSVQDWVLANCKCYGDMDDLYYGMPSDLHQWRAKHSEMLRQFHPEAESIIALIEQLIELRNAIKEADIIAVERKTNDREQSFVKSAIELIQLRKAQFNEGCNLFDLFNGLPVSAKTHVAINQHGTMFNRTFFYMAGRLTPLSVILAVMDAKAD